MIETKKVDENNIIVKVFNVKQPMAEFRVEILDNKSWDVMLVNYQNEVAMKQAMDELLAYANTKQIKLIDFQTEQKDFFNPKPFPYDFLSNNWKEVFCHYVFIFDALSFHVHQKLFEHNVIKEHYSLNDFSTLTPHEKIKVKQGLDVWYPKRMDPLQYDSVEPNSLILRYKNEVVGWCISIGIEDNMTNLDNIYIKHGHRGEWLGGLMLYESATRQLNRTSKRYFTSMVDGKNKKVLNFYRQLNKTFIVDNQKITVYRYTW